MHWWRSCAQARCKIWKPAKRTTIVSSASPSPPTCRTTHLVLHNSPIYLWFQLPFDDTPSASPAPRQKLKLSKLRQFDIVLPFGRVKNSSALKLHSSRSSRIIDNSIILTLYFWNYCLMPCYLQKAGLTLSIYFILLEFSTKIKTRFYILLFIYFPLLPNSVNSLITGYSSRLWDIYWNLSRTHYFNLFK